MMDMWIDLSLAFLMLFFSLGMMIYLYMIMPGQISKEKMSCFLGYHYAHRGFYDNGRGIPENSVPAFQRAIDHGYGVELDVQLTSDGKLVVFHDKTLKRMCDEKQNLYELNYNQLKDYKLAETEESIPVFSQVLSLIDGRVPLVIEVKDYHCWENVVKSLVDQLDNYKGPFMIVSFNTHLLKWFRENKPDIVRGQIVEGKQWKKGKKKYLRNLPKLFLLTNYVARPHLLSYNVRHCYNISYILCRSFYKPYYLHWPTHENEELKRFSGENDFYVFEWFQPKYLPNGIKEEK